MKAWVKGEWFKEVGVKGHGILKYKTTERVV